MELRLDQVSNTGKKFRLGKIFREDGKTLIVAMSHGLGGPVQGIEQPLRTIGNMVEACPDAFMSNLATLTRYAKQLSVLPAVIWNVGSFYRYLDPQTAFLWVEEALKLGVDGLEFALAAPPEEREEYIRRIGPLGVACEKYGMPLLVEPVPVRLSKEGQRETILDADVVKVFARMASELGADILKVTYSGSPETFKEVVDTCPVPVVIMGGPKTETPRDVLEMVKGCIDAGGSGVAIGRNIWQHKDPTGMCRAVRIIIHEKATVDEAINELKE